MHTRHILLASVIGTLLVGCTPVEKLPCIEGLTVKTGAKVHTIACKQLQFAIECLPESLQVVENRIYCVGIDGTKYEVQDKIEAVNIGVHSEDLQQYVQSATPVLQQLQQKLKELYEFAKGSITL